MINDVLKVNVLGTDYKIVYKSKEDYPKLKTVGASGLCEAYSKKLVVEKSNKQDELNFENIDAYERKVLRHEIIHAFAFESGLIEFFNDERLTDWLAIQIPKIYKTFELTQALDK